VIVLRSALVVVLLALVASCAPGSAREGSIDSALIVVDPLVASTTMFDHRLLGSNLPAWIGPERLAAPEFREATRESGVSLLRMPGGSWSNWYDWAGCEVRDAARCFFIGSARPSDFIDFLQATNLPGMWTLSANATAQSAAATVAFFNGDVDDTRTIGIDRLGVDWGTVATWAALRRAGGNPVPYRIALWEFGNEVFAGRPETGGDQCADFGWEDVWTCDGVEYVLGGDDHDGFLAVREAMIAVDPNIEVGAVGVSGPDDWSRWGSEVVESGGSDIDFYVLHGYGFDESPSGGAAVQRAQSQWPREVANVREYLDGTVPIAVTEYNLVAVEAGDTERTMTQAMNALYIADTIGQLAVSGVSIANQWTLASGTTESGADYGMIDLDDWSRFPQYEAIEMWGRAGSSLLPVDVGDGALRAYATRHEDGRLTLIVLNLAGEESTRTVRLVGADVAGEAEFTSVWTDDLSATTMSRESTAVQPSGGDVDLTLPSWSINVLELAVS
jgi:hypothetical protein